jgi:hypothetical protein
MFPQRSPGAQRRAIPSDMSAVPAAIQRKCTCRRRGRRAAAYPGDAGNDVRIRVPMRVAGNACKRPLL